MSFHMVEDISSLLLPGGSAGKYKCKQSRIISTPNILKNHSVSATASSAANGPSAVTPSGKLSIVQYVLNTASQTFTRCLNTSLQHR